MAIDTSKNPGEQMKAKTGPVLDRPLHDEDEDLDLVEADFEDFGETS